MGNTQLFVQPSAWLRMSAGDRLQLRIRGVPIPGMQLWQGRILELAWRSPLPCPSPNFKGTFLVSAVAVKPGGWQRHYSLVWRRFLSAVTPLGPSRAVSPALIVVFPRDFWFSPCPSSPSADSLPAQPRARAALPKCDPGKRQILQGHLP